jgi:hypothetical protein
MAFAAAAALVASPAFAADTGQIRLGDDYAQFYIGGADWKPCEHECNSDASCQSWSYITTTGQCRLKHSVPPAMANACCVSGVKTAPAAASTDERDCAKVAVAALDAYDDNLANRCALSGPLWSNNYNDTYARCLDSSPRKRARDMDDRKQALEACKQAANQGRNLACDHYARMAVAENQTNQANGCGFSGPAWTASYDGHLKFCQSAKIAAANDQTTAREQQLLRCLDQGGGSGNKDCADYVNTSIGQFAQAGRQRCGAAFSGPLWHGDQAAHYQWCRSHSKAERDQILASRTQALAQCDDDRKHFKLIFKF